MSEWGKMTLIIGFNCKEGTALVSDTKVTNAASGEAGYQSKILTPLADTAFIIGAAGYTDLFNEFNRKIPLRFAERAREYKIRNIDALMKSGLSRDAAIELVSSAGIRTEQQQQPLEAAESKAPEQPKIAEVELPYVYSEEDFLDDCKALITSISSQATDSSYPLEVLVSYLGEAGPSLHYIGANGRESQVDAHAAIGSGSPHVRLFFDRLYSYEKGIYELCSLAFLTIAYVQSVAREPTVGYTEEMPPEAVVVLSNGIYGRLQIKNTKEILDSIRDATLNFEGLIGSVQLPTFDVDMGETPSS